MGALPPPGIPVDSGVASQKAHPVRLLVAGAGARGSAYARLAAATNQAVVVGLAEPRAVLRDRLAAEFGVPDHGLFEDWQAMLATHLPADGIIIATPDRDHGGPFSAAAAHGYSILLEKPVAVDPAGCAELERLSRETGASTTVCHVLRYSPLTALLKQLLSGGAVGRTISIQHLEPVGFWHYAHSYVRGNWRREEESSPFLLAKCTHDIDWLSFIIGSRPLRVSSFGRLSHFRREEAPEGASLRCTDCPAEPRCPYSALRIYGAGRPPNGSKADPARAYFADVVDPGGTPESLLHALATGPYGRCVYSSDNDVVDHQVVNIEYEDGTTAAFTATAFTAAGPRRTRIFGSHGEITVEAGAISVFDFLTGATTVHPVPAAVQQVRGEKHDGGDRGLVQAWVTALAAGDWSGVVSGLEESLVSHAVVFAAEEARRSGSVVQVRPLSLSY
ncbi:oxidoreductase family protein [Arthrobacter sp. SLBN-100]|uniref:Gfo/Idh/MocA family protein n=1 Tax=Arthrobacter sp. SLBN-100 TaxID=2768450 RepID=UPI001171942C|nr:Gfo/Idh/MocA family oxidoreductase [Arthrobacter sp. SLBN-100]TQJ68247.1 oxidoreductase family protein [Arthrobacter sp. SLBN-100]